MPPEATGSSRSDLIAKFLQMRPETGDLPDGIQPRTPGIPVEASKEQEQVWLHNELANGLPVYNEVFILHFSGPFDRRAFELALNRVIERHEAWRTGFSWDDGILLQLVSPKLDITIPFIDLSEASGEAQRKSVAEQTDRLINEPFDVAKVPLYRFLLVKTSDREHELYCTIHHLISDGVSMFQIFLPELQECYRAYLSSGHPTLPDLPVQYPDYAVWQQECPSEPGANDLQFWKETLTENFPGMEPVFDRLPPPRRDFAGGIQPFSLSADITEELRSLARTSNATLFMVLAAALHVVIFKRSGLRDQVICTATAGRKQEHCEHLLGLFANTIILRIQLDPDMPFRKLIDEVRQKTVDALCHEIDFHTLVAQFGAKRPSGVRPLARITFSFEPAPPKMIEGWTVRSSYAQGTSKNDLDLQIGERESGLVGRFAYLLDVLDQETVMLMSHQFQSVLALAASNPDWSITELCETVPEAKAADSPSFIDRIRNVFRPSSKLSERHESGRFKGTD